MHQNLVAWFLEGEVGESSKAMAAKLSGWADRKGKKAQRFTSYPLDAGDFRRCLLMLEAVPELAPLLPKMAEVGPVWAALVSVWPELTVCLETECPGWRQKYGPAPETYALIRAVVDGARV